MPHRSHPSPAAAASAPPLKQTTEPGAHHTRPRGRGEPCRTARLAALPLRMARPAVTPSAEGGRPGAVTAATRRAADPQPRALREPTPPLAEPRPAPDPTRGRSPTAARGGKAGRPVPARNASPAAAARRRSPPSAQDGGCRPPFPQRPPYHCRAAATHAPPAPRWQCACVKRGGGAWRLGRGKG